MKESAVFWFNKYPPPPFYKGKVKEIEFKVPENDK